MLRVFEINLNDFRIDSYNQSKVYIYGNSLTIVAHVIIIVQWYPGNVHL